MLLLPHLLLPMSFLSLSDNSTRGIDLVTISKNLKSQNLCEVCKCKKIIGYKITKKIFTVTKHGLPFSSGNGKFFVKSVFNLAGLVFSSLTVTVAIITQNSCQLGNYKILNNIL